MPVADVNSVQLAYEDEGSGDPLILVHGSWTNRHSWDRVAPRLAERFRVVRHDRRGHSESSAASGTLEDDAADIAALADHLELGPFHLACSSRGGVIGLKLIAARPELVRSIVCHEPPLLGVLSEDGAEGELLTRLVAEEGRVVEMIETGDHEAAARFFVEKVAYGPGAWARFPRFLRQTYVENAETFAEEYRDPGGYSVDLEALGRFRGPVLLTSSDNSPEWFGVVIDRLARRLPRVERHEYRGAGHNPQGMAAEEYVRVVGDFVARAAKA
ncbi:MAG TPA: alpha/beta hydrolase [Actinomycetota bacterium]|nr:alpha/beta hydrolase [Actinomycetota bacterium]